MLVGEFDHTIDEKSRLTLPAKFRQAFAGGLVVTRGMDGCLYVFPRDEWEASVEARLAGLDPLSKEGRLMQRYFYSGAAEAEPDKQGRVMVPSALAEHAGLGREVVIAGVRDHLEIWDRTKWREHVREIEGSAEHVAERLATKRD
jgi:MraZ protein